MEGFFISHSKHDGDTARRLAMELRQMGKDVWIYSDGIQPGENLPVQINGALKKCKVFMLLWSKNAKKSKWVELEWSAAMMNHKRTIISCLLDQTRLPDLLQTYRYIDFRDFNIGWSELLKTLN